MAASDDLLRARQLLARGLSVIPIPAPGGRFDGKTPAIAWRAYQQRHPTDDELVSWFAGPPMNLAIVTGAISGVVVVDLDDDAARQWWTRHRPYTPWQVRTARGWHAYYRHPGVVVANRARLTGAAIDVRGDGGYVIAPGSTHASGAVYRPAADWTAPRGVVPGFWPGWLARPERPAGPPRRRAPPSSSDPLARPRRYLAAIPRPEIRQGSDVAVLSAACRLVRGFQLDAETAAALLWQWCGGRPGWTYEWVQRKVAHAQRYGTEPSGGLLA